MSEIKTITRDLIFKAADQIATDGRIPTIEAVKELLADWTGGKGGSYATLSPAIRDWKAKRRENEASTKDLPPLNLGDQIADMASKIWSDAVEAANSRFALDLEAAKQAQSETEAALAEAESMIGKLENRLEASEAEATTEREKAATNAATIEELRRQVEQIREEAGQRLAAAEGVAQREREAAEQARTELAKAQLRLESMPRLETDLTESRNEARTLQKALAEAQSQAASLKSTVEALRASESRLLEQVDAGKGEIADLRLQVSAIRTEKEAALLENAKLATRLEAAQEQIANHNAALLDVVAEVVEPQPETTKGKNG